ncbi:MAG: hypothetical protein JNM30_16940, partial [Rhodospirillales bacterium]|nr:hypothetical protein [Rhodospirillales bacterium]
RCFEATVTVDRKRFAGRFLLIEAMNLCQLGPNLALAPHADPGDGMLDVVMVRSNEREALRRYLAGEKGAPPPTVARGRRVTQRAAPDAYRRQAGQAGGEPCPACRRERSHLDRAACRAVCARRAGAGLAVSPPLRPPCRGP